jgi:hypothetical protein
VHEPVMLFLFLAAATVAVFAFLSVAAWAAIQAQDRKSRDRFALLKSLAESPNENAMRVLETMREDEARERTRKDLEARRGFMVGGLVCIAAGVGTAIMVSSLTPEPVSWTVGLVPLLIGVVLTAIALSTKPGK